MNLQLGQQVVLKKKHPCGGNTFRVTRFGMDIRLQCETCGREVLLPRKKAERAIRAVSDTPEDKDRHV